MQLLNGKEKPMQRIHFISFVVVFLLSATSSQAATLSDAQKKSLRFLE